MRDFSRGAAGARLGLKGWGRGVLRVHNLQHLKLHFICDSGVVSPGDFIDSFIVVAGRPLLYPCVFACVSFVDFPPFQPTLTGICALDLSRVAALRDLGTSTSTVLLMCPGRLWNLILMTPLKRRTGRGYQPYLHVRKVMLRRRRFFAKVTQLAGGHMVWKAGCSPCAASVWWLPGSETPAHSLEALVETCVPCGRVLSPEMYREIDWWWQIDRYVCSETPAHSLENLCGKPCALWGEAVFWDDREISSVQFSGSVVSDSFQLHRLQHTRPPCPSPNPRVYSNSCPWSWWCHPTIPSSVIPFFSHLQSFPTTGSCPMSQFFASDCQSIGVSASASVLPMNIQDYFLCLFFFFIYFY